MSRTLKMGKQSPRTTLLQTALLLTLLGTSGCAVDRTFFSMSSDSPMPFFGFDLRLPRRTTQVDPPQVNEEDSAPFRHPYASTATPVQLVSDQKTDAAPRHAWGRGGHSPVQPTPFSLQHAEAEQLSNTQRSWPILLQFSARVEAEEEISLSGPAVPFVR